MCCSSVASLRRNLRRAGTLKKRSRTSTVVPGGCAAGAACWPLLAVTFQPCAACAVRDVISRRDTEAMLGRASPRKPKLTTCSRSSSALILLVAWRASANGNSSAAMPLPSSRTRHNATPPLSTSMSMRRAPASRAFSTSSLMTEAGRSTTSPAAIWLMSSGSRMRMGMGRRWAPAVYPQERPLAQKFPRSKLARVDVRAAVLGEDLAVRRRALLRNELGDPGAGWRVVVEITSNARVDRVRELILAPRILETFLFTGIGDVRGLDQQRGDVGRLQDYETCLLHVALAHFANPIEFHQHALGGGEARGEARGL